MSRIRNTLVPLLFGCASCMAHSQPGMPDEDNLRRFGPIIDSASRRHGVEAALVHAVIFTESSYDPRAVSAQGAMGLMQLMPETARQYGVTDALDPAQNVEGGVRMLRELLDRFDDDMELALAAFNAGPNAVIRAGHRVPPYDETRAFVPRVLGRYRAYQASVDSDASHDGRIPHDRQADAPLRAVFAAPAPPPLTQPDTPEHGKRPPYLASARRQRRANPARIFGTGTGPLPRPEPFRSRRGHKSIEDMNEVPMATEKRSTPRKSSAEPAPQITPMPFPGESPTVSLALAAGQMYGLKPEDEKPARPTSKRRRPAAKRPARAGKAKAASKAKRPTGARGR